VWRQLRSAHSVPRAVPTSRLGVHCLDSALRGPLMTLSGGLDSAAGTVEPAYWSDA
jgi:hypothetical protein